MKRNGFTLVELVTVIVILGIMAAAALPKFVNIGKDARVASINSLAGSVRTALGNVAAVVQLKNYQYTLSGWLTMPDGTQVRMWGVYPDQWCDGIGAAFQGVTIPNGGCYMNVNPVDFNGYTFYGWGNTTIPGGKAGWRIENAPDPMNCSVQYDAANWHAPYIVVTTSGC